MVRHTFSPWRSSGQLQTPNRINIFVRESSGTAFVYFVATLERSSTSNILSFSAPADSCGGNLRKGSQHVLSRRFMPPHVTLWVGMGSKGNLGASQGD